MHRFEHGLVVETKEQGLLAFHLDHLSIDMERRFTFKGSFIHYYDTDWQFQRGGRFWKTSTSLYPETHRRERENNPTDQLYEGALREVCARHVERAGGGPIAWEPRELDRWQLRFGLVRTTVPWAKVTLVSRGEDLQVRAQREVFPEPGFRLLSSRQVVVETHPQAGRTGNAPIAPNFPLLKELVSTVRGQQ